MQNKIKIIFNLFFLLIFRLDVSLFKIQDL